MNIQEEYPYLYETHLHTAQGSACARSSGAEMARACKAYGYAGIFVTDHNWGGNTAVDRDLPWEVWVEQYCKGFEEAKAEGERIGLDVFFGCESGFDGTEFLLYGIDKDWMKKNPALWTATVEEQYTLVHEAGGLVMQAHPFRKEAYIPEVRLYPEWVDGVEALNAAHHLYSEHGRDKTAFDVSAIAYAKENGLPMSAGSDIHSAALYGGGTAFRRKLKSAADYVQAILCDEDRVMTDGRVWYDKKGNVLA